MKSKISELENFLLKKKISLRSWQEEAIYDFLEAIKKQRGNSGRTFLCDVMVDFLTSCNLFDLARNDFCEEQEIIDCDE